METIDVSILLAAVLLGLVFLGVRVAFATALIGFAGPRVIEQTIREKLPEGFQRSEYLLEKGMVDKVVHRREIPATLSRMLRVMLKRPGATMAALTPPPPDHVAEDDGAAH